MKLYRGSFNQLQSQTGTVVTIGNFDGVHLGHEQLLAHTGAKAKALGALATVVLFEPHPRLFFGGVAPPVLTSFSEKLHYLRAAGMDQVFCVRFDAPFSQLSSTEFVQKFLCDRLQLRGLVVGRDFHFGAGRQGDVHQLRVLAKQFNFQLQVMTDFEASGARVSSSRIRRLLEAGDIAMAHPLLGRPYSISGHVTYGQQLGRQLGFPTANISISRRTVPVHGIFIVRVLGMGSKTYYGVASVGTRPTVTQNQQCWLEVYLFDFSGDCYGQKLTVSFLHKIRDEAYFPSLDLLKQQMEADVVFGRRWLKL